MDCWESSMGSEVNYELYINSCLSNATKAVKDGTLTIKDDSATIRDNNGNVIDENYDSQYQSKVCSHSEPVKTECGADLER